MADKFQLIQAPHSFSYELKKPENHDSNFLESLLPTIGGIGGGIGGGALGGALAGSAILPGIGTAAGGLIGALLGGAAGGAGGQALENELTGKDLGHDVLKEGLIQGAFSAGPLRLLKGVKAVGKAGVAASREGKGLANAINTAEKASTPLKTSAAGKLENWGNNQLAKQYGTVSRPVARQTKPLETIGKLADMGITKPEEAERIANAVTGADGLINRAVGKAVAGSKPLNLSGLNKSVTTAIKDSGLTDRASKGLKAEIGADLRLIKPGEPASALKVMRNLEARANEYMGKGGTYHLPTSLDKKRAGAIMKVKDELQNTLFDAAGANANVGKVLTPTLRSQLLKLHPNNKQWTDAVDKLMQSKTIDQLRAAQAPFVRVRRLIDDANTGAMTFGGRAGNAIANGQMPHPVGMAVSATADAVKTPAARASGKLARSMAKGRQTKPMSLNEALNSVTAPTKKSIVRNEVLGNVARAALPGGQPGTQQPNGQSERQALLAAANPPTGSGMGSEATAPQASTSPFDPANLEANIKKLVMNGASMDQVANYINLVGAVNQLEGGASGSEGLNSTAAGVIADTKTGLQALDGLQQQLNQSNANGPIVGQIRAHIPWDTNAQTLQAAVATAKQIVGKALEGGVLRKEDEAKYAKLLPTMGDTDAVANNKINALRQLISSRLAQYEAGIGGGGGGLDLASVINAGS